MTLIPKVSDTSSGYLVSADFRYSAGPFSYSTTWILLAIPFTGILGVHRFYMGKWVTGIIYLCTGGLFGIGIIYDYWTLNEQLSELNSRMSF